MASDLIQSTYRRAWWALVIRGVLALALWAMWVAGGRSPTLMVALVAGGGLAFGATMPSWQAFLTELVPRDDLLNAVTLNSAQFNGARALGPRSGRDEAWGASCSKP